MVIRLGLKKKPFSPPLRGGFTPPPSGGAVRRTRGGFQASTRREPRGVRARAQGARGARRFRMHLHRPWDGGKEQHALGLSKLSCNSQ